MILPVFHQGGLFLVTIAAGLILAFFYDIFRAARRIAPHSALLIHIEDFSYWLIVIAAVSALLFVSNSGELRLFVIVGVFAGMFVYYSFISAIFLRLSMAIYGFLKSVALLIFSIVSAPFRALWSILSYPLGIAAGKARELYGYERRMYTGIKIRGRRGARRFKNDVRIIFKKI